MPVITLLTDFGTKDPYVAEMKAVIISICPEAQIIDISHEIEKFNIRMGAFTLASAVPYFPEKTIHVAVVDPGVGTKRHPIIVETQRCSYVGPDNGILMLSAQKGGIKYVYQISNPMFMLSKVSKTFHGRDIFAPAAAHLAKGKLPSEFGPEISDYVVPEFAKARIRGNELLGEIMHIDDFGNVISNISAEDLGEIIAKEGGFLNVKFREKILRLRFCSAYGDVHAKEPLALVGSHDFLEFSVNQGNAAKKFKVKVGDSVRLLRC
jgi:S-adenosylmethionine hydrolase